jgi:hypothetical protein
MSIGKTRKTKHRGHGWSVHFRDFICLAFTPDVIVKNKGVYFKNLKILSKRLQNRCWQWRESLDYYRAGPCS